MHYADDSFRDTARDEHDIEDLLSDRIVHLIWARDGISRDDVAEAVRTAQANVGARPTDTSSADVPSTTTGTFEPTHLWSAADAMRHARCVQDLRAAIEHNLVLWTRLVEMAHTQSARRAASIKEAARYVIERTLSAGRATPEDSVIEHFIRINESTAALLGGGYR